MRYRILFGLFVLSLVMCCACAATVQLGGVDGRAILMQVSSANVTNEVVRASSGDLWSFGKVPMNYAIESGRPKELAAYDDYDLWLWAANGYMPLNVSVYN